MTDQYRWNRGRSTSDEIADADDPRYETPGGAQNKANAALEDAKEYADEIPKYTQINGIGATIPEDNFTVVGGIGIRVDNGDQLLTITATGPVDIDPIPLSKVYDAGTAAYKDAGNATGNVPVIGVDGYLDTSILPALAVTDTFVVNTEAAMLALSAQIGDVAVRTDLSKSYILKVASPSVLANWQELLTPTSPVQSVAGKTGVVTLTSSDVGLGNVTNESKSTMFTSPTFTGNPVAPTQATTDNSTRVASTAFVKSLGYTLPADVVYGMNKQALINGGIEVWQRGTSFSAAGYTADRWKWNKNGSGQVGTVTQQAFAFGQTEVPFNPKYYLRNQVTTAGTGQTVHYLSQSIEGVEKFSGMTVTFSLYAKADASRQLKIYAQQNFGTGGSTAVTTSISTITLTTSWQKFDVSVAIPSISGKTVGASDHLEFFVEYPMNTTFTIDIAQIQAAYGSTVFHPRHIAEEISLCQRYYQRFENEVANTRIGVGYAISTTQANIMIHTIVKMRTIPTLSYSAIGDLFVSDGVAATVLTGLTIGTSTSGTEMVTLFPVVASGLTTYRPYDIEFGGSGAKYLAFDADF